MKPIYNNLLRLALSVGLTQRELFIEKVSALLTERANLDEEQGEKLAESVLSMAESLKDELFLRELFSPSNACSPTPQSEESVSSETAALSKRIEALNQSIGELTAALKQKS